MPISRQFRRLGPVLICTTFALSACGGGGGSGPAFDMGAQTDTCLHHQSHRPTTPYEGGSGGTTVRVLDFLGYYTAHGTQPFCDGKKANSKDKAWAQLYVTLTGNSTKVTTILG